MATKEKSKVTAEDYEKLGRAIESSLVNDYVDWLGNTKKQIWQALVRGIFMGLGTVIGATLIVALLVWLLHVLGGVPLIGHFLTDTSRSIHK